MNQAKEAIITFDELFDLLLERNSSKKMITRQPCINSVNHLRPWFRENAGDLKSFSQSYESIWAKYRKEHEGKRLLEHDRRYLTAALKIANEQGWIHKSFKKSHFQINPREHEERYLNEEKITK